MTLSTRSGIPTTYQGTNFRSRLEARWAAFFDLVGWNWTYEPLDLAGWIPDFLIHGDQPFLVEVGACLTEHDLQLKASKVIPHSKDYRILVVGTGPLMGKLRTRGDVVAGLFLGEHAWGFPLDDSQGSWTRCERCRRIAVFHTSAAFDCHPCGHYDGDNYLGYVNSLDIEQLWRQAGNQVQWRR